MDQIPAAVPLPRFFVSTCRRWLGHFALALALAVAGSGPLSAKEEPEDEGPPEPEEIELVTKDGVQLKATWYASRRKKEAVPVILLHMFRGSRADYRDFALFLQRDKHHAVIVPDLRGHGDSTVQTLPDGDRRDLEPQRLRPDDFDQMATEDVEAVKRFLMQRNNAGELNIEKLCVVGAEMGAMVAVGWAFTDWAWDKGQSLTFKQGSDVKALVLISPDARFKNLQSSLLVQPPVAGKLSLQIVAGSGNAKSVKSARQIYNIVKRFYNESAGETPLEERRLFLDIGYNTSLQGTKMFGAKLGLEENVAKFIELRLVDQSYPWKERKNPL